jgi:RHS repeat-associated protein
MQVVQERDGQNRATAKNFRVGNIGGILARTAINPATSAASTCFYHYDGSGNVTQLTDTSGAVVASYAYDSFGNTLSATGAQAAANPYRYQTKEQHAASGLYDFGFRFYSPGLGRWLNRDPLREDGGLNLYAAFANNPGAFADPYGLSNCGRFFGSMIGGLMGGIFGGGVPGAAIGTGVGSFIGGLIDGKPLPIALMNGAMDGGAAFVGGKILQGLGGAVAGKRRSAGSSLADDAHLILPKSAVVRTASGGGTGFGTPRRCDKCSQVRNSGMC